MASLIKIKFEFEDTETARLHLASSLDDRSWLDKKERPSLHVGAALLEPEALFILSKVMQHGGEVKVELSEKVKDEIKHEVKIVAKSAEVKIPPIKGAK